MYQALKWASELQHWLTVQNNEDYWRFTLGIILVQLSAEVGIGSTVEVTIEGSDNAYGTFQFADVSLAVTASEVDVGTSTATLQVLCQLLDVS